MRIEIKHGIGCLECKYFNDAGGCAFGRHMYVHGEPFPSTSCHPGVYELVPEGQVDRMRRYRVEQDCRYTIGDVADTGGSHCPSERPCERCKMERLEAENEQLRKCLLDIAEHNIEKVHATKWRRDGEPRKFDLCPHGTPISDDCERCIGDFARAALEVKP